MSNNFTRHLYFPNLCILSKIFIFFIFSVLSSCSTIGTVIFESNVNEAILYIDGEKMISKENVLKIHNLKSGSHVLRICKNGYRTIIQKINVEAGKESIVNCMLVKASQISTIQRYEHDSGALSVKYTCQHDENGLITRLTLEYPDRKYPTTYNFMRDVNGRINTLTYDSEEDHQIERWENEFDSINKVMTQKMYRQGKLERNMTYQYNTIGQIEMEDIFYHDNKDSSVILSHLVAKRHYDANGRLISFIGAGVTSLYGAKYEFQYDTYGRVVNRKVYLLSTDSEGVSDEVVLLAAGVNEEYKHRAMIVPFYENTYAYDDNGLLIEGSQIDGETNTILEDYQYELDVYPSQPIYNLIFHQLNLANIDLKEEL